MFSYHSGVDNTESYRLQSGLFFRASQAEPSTQNARHVRLDRSAHEEAKYKNSNSFVSYTSAHSYDSSFKIPLLQVNIEVEVVGTLAWTKLTQTFTNLEAQPISETVYVFPLYETSTITSFNCVIGCDRVLKGVVKSTAKAKADFGEAVAGQRVAALLEEHTPEVFEASIGNIPAQSTVQVEICYITELKADITGDGIQVIIPTSVAPRYGMSPNFQPNYGSAKSLAVPPENGLRIGIDVSSHVTISKIESPTHPVSIEMGSCGNTVTRDIRDVAAKRESASHALDFTKARVVLSSRSACLGKDFVLLIYAKNEQLLSSRAFLEPHPHLVEHSSLMLSINLRDLHTPNVVSPKESKEIIFLVDRSGSMGDKMDGLKVAMRFFVKSLPNNCTFNIFSFGTISSALWPKSREYTQANVDIALSLIAENLAADLGGTELLSGLTHLVKTITSLSSTEIIVLTDGEIWDINGIFQFIQEVRSARPTKSTRFFCLGIGEAVSHRLVRGIGHYGGGVAEVVPVDGTGDWMRKVTRMLSAALTPSSWKIEIISDDLTAPDDKRTSHSFVQAPHNIPECHSFSRTSIYFFLRKRLSTRAIKIKATSISTGEFFTRDIPIETLQSQRHSVHVLAAKATLNDIETGRSWHHTARNAKIDNAAGDADIAKLEAEKLGIEWQVSSKWTSFVITDDGTSRDKLARLHPSRNFDLDDLTRPRLGTGAQPSGRSTLGPGYLPDYLNGIDSPTCDIERVQSPDSGEDEPPRKKRGRPPQAEVKKSGDTLRRGEHKVRGSQVPAHTITPSTASEQNPSRVTARTIAPRVNGMNPPKLPGESTFSVTPPVTVVRVASSLSENLSVEDCQTKYVSSSLELPPPWSLLSPPPLPLPVVAPGMAQETLLGPSSRRLTLIRLLDSQTTGGAFKLSSELRKDLAGMFKSSLRDCIVIFAKHLPKGAMKINDMVDMRDTAMSIVYIEQTFPSDKELWVLVVQKARACLQTLITEETDLEKLFDFLRSGLH